MRAAVLQELKGRLQVQERPIPNPGPGQALVRVHACGVCHGDLMVRDGDFPFVRCPIVPGHEIAGVVERLGPGVSEPALGTRVGLGWLYGACGHCTQCIAGHEVLCSAGQYSGMTCDGGFQEFVVARSDYLTPLPDALGFSDAAPLMCAGLTVFTGLRYAGFRPGQRVAVVGLGGLGDVAVQFVRAMGGRAVVVSSSPGKERRAHELGAERFLPVGDGLTQALLGWEGGADIVLQVAPDVQSANAALRGMACDGTFVMLAPVPITPDHIALVMRRQRLMGSPSGSRQELRAALQIAASHGIRPLVRRLPLEQADAALSELANTRPAGRLVLVSDTRH